MPAVKKRPVLCKVVVCFVCHDFQWMHEGSLLLDELHYLLTVQMIGIMALLLMLIWQLSIWEPLFLVSVGFVSVKWTVAV